MILCVGMLRAPNPFHHVLDAFVAVRTAATLVLVADYNAYGQIISSPSVSLVPDVADVTDPGAVGDVVGCWRHIAAHTGVRSTQSMSIE
jgi:hypothetical protein